MLRTRLSEAMKESMRAKNEKVLHTVRLIMAKLKDADIAARPKGVDKISDDEVAATLRGIPTLLHEQNGVMGRASVPSGATSTTFGWLTRMFSAS